MFGGAIAGAIATSFGLRNFVSSSRPCPSGVCIINPGSVGQPRDDNPLSSFGIYDPEAQTVTTRRVPYDIAAVQEKMRRARLPGYLVDRLARGR